MRSSPLYNVNLTVILKVNIIVLDLLETFLLIIKNFESEFI
jgi:hypothetical protein